ncbi:TetR/AcrR family transcriptional regulator, partial [Anaerolineales bacterium HSG24]|nr:TetR/AcrR family transcriptional regulator [Anaerolineales bacterium HSG24]
ARIVKDPDVRRAEILDVAQRFFYQRGYEQTSVQGIITEVGIAKGTFYHYFNCKLDLLDAVIERMIDQQLQSLEPLVADDQLSALEKFERFYKNIADWKIENKAFFLDLMKIWYKDENTILRYKVSATSTEKIKPLLAQIIEQGIAEGAFTTKYPADIAELILQLGQSLSDTLSRLIMNEVHNDGTLGIIERKRIVYHQAIERILNAQAGSIQLFDLTQVRLWLK